MKKPAPSQELPGLIAERKRMYESRLKAAQSIPGRVCNASSKLPYSTPVWPSARVSAADVIQTKGQMC